MISKPQGFPAYEVNHLAAHRKGDERRPPNKRRITMTTTSTASKIVNGVAVEDLVATVGAITAAPALAAFSFRVRNQWTDGSRSNSTANTFHGAGQELSRPHSFVLEADEPTVLLGKDTAANPAEYLLHALAACLTSAMVYQAAARGIEIQAIESSLEGDVDLRGFLDLDKRVRNGLEGIRVQFKIKADVPDEQLNEIVQLGPKRSPVFDTLTNGVPISVTAERL
jgi:uncharacterized OsmC-like protein